MRRTRRLWLVLGCALPLSQLGHALAGELVRPGRALTEGPQHGYLGPWLDLSVALVGGGLLVALFVVGLARRLSARPLARGTGWPLVWICLGLAGVQLEVFLGQELIEGSDPTGILLPGLAGQIPVALVAGIAIRWLSTRLSPALRRLLMGPPSIAIGVASPLGCSPAQFVPARETRLASSRAPRGPPRLLLKTA